MCVWDSGGVCRGWWRCVEGIVEVCVRNGVGVGDGGGCGADGGDVYAIGGDVYGIGGGA